MKKLMSNKEYHASDAIGSSLLKKITEKSVLHAMEPVEETDNMRLGSALHAAVLEPETFDNEFLVAPKVDRRTTKGKEIWAEFQEKAQGKTLLKDQQLEDILAMKQSILSHPLASKMIEGGESEYSYFAKDEKTGLMKKCRPDIKNVGTLIDIKTCQDASPSGFLKACINLLYHVQGAYYLDVHNEATGEKLEDFYFIAVESKAPYAVACYKLGEVELGLGRDNYRKALNEYAAYLNNKDAQPKALFSYQPVINEIQFPIWALEKYAV